MTTLLAWIIGVICTQLLVKSYLETSLKPYGGLCEAWRKCYRNDPETTEDELWELDKVPDEFFKAVFWTLVLIFNIALWWFSLCAIIWFKVFPIDIEKEISK
jgi:hypothetical protein